MPLKETLNNYDDDEQFINFYNKFLHILDTNENIPDFMKLFYKESWSNIDIKDMLNNILWYCKSDLIKKNELDNDLDLYFINNLII